ncbi:RNA polymerase sigma factor (plasmid) [Azospirillum sp. TSA2s]|uniref:RNA polymerase sigma factor n=1 Tax=Azospirillum sp. TSA2s TaxID=709810 RepID=UPI0010A9B492|nr:RNA polymerase sigma factor [Azospirillum sp. TSA2s]QCG99325.1 RNA polymerase sigma factor [Azospirillum sp. TSA2s]
MTDTTLKGLFLAHKRNIQAYLTRRLKDAEVAADLTQETFLRYAEQSSAITYDRSYLYRTAHNLAVDHMRHQTRRPVQLTADDNLEAIPEDRPSLEDAASAKQSFVRLRQAVAELPERTRLIFTLVRLEGLTYAQAAERLGLSESSIQKHLAKALERIMERMES